MNGNYLYTNRSYWQQFLDLIRYLWKGWMK